MPNKPTTTAPKPRSLWPIAIIAYFAIFITACIGLVAYCSLHKVDLVSQDYYAQELRYQDQIDRQARTLGVQSQVRISFNPTNRLMTIALPAGHAQPQPTGSIYLYRPSAASLDRHLALAPDSAGMQALDTRMLQPGLWRVRVTWNVERQQFYCDQKLVIPAFVLH